MPIDIVVMKAVNADNEDCARRVRKRLDEAGVFCLNMMSSPGSGKTALLEATLEKLGSELKFGVIEGDVFTAKDAERVARYGVQVLQVNTEGSCHMTAHMVEELLPRFDLDSIDILVIENIGNLICPASFSLGEHKIAACLSTTEGSDKVEKYPKLFRISQVNVITKADLVEHLDFDIPEAGKQLMLLNPEAPLYITSSRNGDGMDDWCSWLREQLRR